MKALHRHRRQTPAAWALTLALFCLPLSASANEADSLPTDCADVPGASRAEALTCAEASETAAQAALQQTLGQLQQAMRPEELAQLDASQRHWEASSAADCTLLVALAGDDNPAWQLTWGDIALLDCTAGAAETRVQHLQSLVRLLAQREQQQQLLRENAALP